MPTGPPDPSPPVEADFGTTVSTPSPASAPSSTAYSSAPHGNTQATHTARDTTKINKRGAKTRSRSTRPHSAGGVKTRGRRSGSHVRAARGTPVLCPPVSAVDAGHVGVVVPGPGRGGQGVEAGELDGGEDNGVGGGVLLHAGHPAGTGDRGNVFALREQPGQRDLGRRGADVRADCPHLFDQPQVGPERLA